MVHYDSAVTESETQVRSKNPPALDVFQPWRSCSAFSFASERTQSFGKEAHEPLVYWRYRSKCASFDMRDHFSPLRTGRKRIGEQDHFARDEA